MPNPTWPSTLPNPVADTTATYGDATNSIRTPMEAGVAKERRRFSSVATPFTCTVKLTQAQYTTLIAFYEQTLLDVLPFDWTDFRTGLPATYKFTKRPSGAYVQDQINRWLVTLSLEKLP